MWTAKIDRKDKSDGNPRVFVQYDKDDEHFEEMYTLRSLEELDSNIKNKLAELESLDDKFDKVQLGQYVIRKTALPDAPVQDQVVFEPAATIDTPPA